MKYLYFTILLGVVALQGTIGSPVEREADATNIFGCIDGGICKVSLKSDGGSDKGKYVAVEKNNKVNANRGALASDGIWEVNFHGKEKKLVSFKGANGRFMIAHPNGKIEAKAKRVSRWEEFTVEAKGNGSFAIKTHHKEYVVAKDGAFSAIKGVKAADATIFKVGQAATNQFGCVVGAPCLVSLKSDNGKGKYVAVGSSDKDVNAKLDAIGPDALWELAFVKDSKDKVSFKSARGKYMIAHKNGKIEATEPDVNTWEMYTLEDKGNGKFAIKTHHNRYLVSCHGNLNSINDANAETFEIVHQTKNILGCIDGGICKVSLLGSKAGKYVAVADNNRDLNANLEDIGPDAIWEVDFIEHEMVSFKGSNGKFMMAHGSGQITFAGRVSRWEEFMLEDRGKGTFAIKSYHKQYLLADLKQGGRLKSKKGRKIVSAADAETFEVAQVDN